MMTNKLSDDALEQVNGGLSILSGSNDDYTDVVVKVGTCPKCGDGVEIIHHSGTRCTCKACGHNFQESDVDKKTAKIMSGDIISGRC